MIIKTLNHVLKPLGKRFSKAGVGPLKFIESNVNKFNYLELLDDLVCPYIDVLERRYKEVFTFQHDNASSHTSLAAEGKEEFKGWFEELNIPLLFHPGNSPDINPIENLWDLVDKAVRKFPVTDNENEFRRRLEEAWNQISKETCVNLLNSMDKRVKMVKDNSYYAIPY